MKFLRNNEIKKDKEDKMNGLPQSLTLQTTAI